MTTPSTPPRPPASPGVSFTPPDMATILASAVEALSRVIATKPDSDRILAEMVRLSGGALQAGAAGTWVTQTPDSPELILEHNLGPIGLMSGNTPLAGLNVAVRRAAREGKPVIVPAFFVDQDAGAGGGAGGPPGEIPSNPSPYELLFIPMKMHGKVAMVLMMAVAPSNDAGMHRTQINFLQKMVSAVEATLTERHLSLMEKDHGTTSKILRFAEQVHKHLFVGQVAVDIANLVRDATESDRVTVELYPKVRKKIVAVSNVDEPSKRSVVFQAQRLILDYVRDRQVPIVLDRAAAKQLVSDPALQDAATAYFAASPFDAFLASPIKHEEQVLGVVITEFSDTRKGQGQSGLLTDLCRVAASSVTNAVEYENIPLRKTLHAIGKVVKAPASTKRTLTISVVGALLIAAAIIGVIPMDFAVKTDCTLRPVAHHSIVAPTDGKIIEVNVRAGEHVYPDPNPDKLPLDKLDEATRQRVESVKPLIVFDDTQLKAERLGLEYKLAELQAKYDAIGTSGTGGGGRDDGRAPRGVLLQQMESARVDIETLTKRIAACRVYSPIEGTVLTENIESRKYSTVKLGEPLVDVASFKDFVLVVDVPESEVATVRGALDKATRRGINDGTKEDPGIPVDYILKPWPDQRYTVRARGAAKLLPSSVQSADANVFRLEIPLDPADLPPNLAMSGVTGRAKVHIGRKPLATQWFRGPVRLWKMTVGF